MVIVATDSCASVPESLVADLGIQVIPYYLHSGEQTWRDGVDMRPDDFFEWVKTAVDWPTTANPSSGEYLDVLRHSAQQQAAGVVIICMTSVGSGGFQAAELAQRLAATELPDLAVEVVDTQQVGMAHGWAVIQAARAALRGASLADVALEARRVAASAFVAFTNDTLEYLQRGGRIGKVASMVGELLSIKPILGIRNGMPVPLGVARTRQKAYQRMISLAIGRIPTGKTVRAALMHVSAADEAEKLRPLVEARYSVLEWLTTQLSPALGVHSGPGTVGIALIPDATLAGG